MHSSESNFFSYRVTHIHPFNEFVSQIFLQPSSSSTISYEAGQYVNVLHPNKMVSSLSIACAPKIDKTLEFHFFHSLENQLAQQLLRLANQEHAWQLSSPLGTCTVSRIHLDKPIIFLARGTGFAPIKAVIEAFASAESYPAMHLYWSMPRREHFYLLDVLDAWSKQLSGFAFTLLYHDQERENPHLLQERILYQQPQLAELQVYASGSQPFVSSVFSALTEKGLNRELFYSDMI